MIRRALNSMWGVGMMSVAALVLVYSNIVAPLLKTDSEQTSFPVAVESASLTGKQVDGEGEVKRFEPVDPTQIHWVDRINRDPFLLQQAHEKTSVKPVVKEPVIEQALPVPVAPVLTLKAIAVEGRKRTAVINRTILQEGDSLMGFRVISIQPDGVWLQEGRHRRFLTFTEVYHSHETS